MHPNQPAAEVVLGCLRELARSGCRKRKAVARLNSKLTTSASAEVKSKIRISKLEENGRSVAVSPAMR